MDKKTVLLAITITLQLLVIVALGLYITNKRKNILGSAVYNPIKREIITPSSSSNLLHFYEPLANTKPIVNDWVPYAAENTINGDSLNDRYDYSVEKPPQTYRIITLGDSYTYGLYVPTPNNWTEVLEDKLNQLSCNGYTKFEVINLGVYGYDVQYSAERYRLRGHKYEPDLILWFLKGEDLAQINELMLPLEKKYSQAMHQTGEYEAEVAKGNLYPSWSKAYKETYQKYGEQEILSRQKTFLTDFSSAYPTKLLIFTFSDTPTKYQNIFQDLTQTNSHTNFFNDLTDVSAVKGATFPNDDHPTVTGHRLIADNLLRYLQDKLLSCP